MNNHSLHQFADRHISLGPDEQAKMLADLGYETPPALPPSFLLFSSCLSVWSSSDKHMVSVNWLLNDEPLSVKDALALELADDLLVGTSAATLRKALTDSGLGESVIGGGLSSELLQNTYSIGLKVCMRLVSCVSCVQ